jgi:hypothetical protein
MPAVRIRGITSDLAMVSAALNTVTGTIGCRQRISPDCAGRREGRTLLDRVIGAVWIQVVNRETCVEIISGHVGTASTNQGVAEIIIEGVRKVSTRRVSGRAAGKAIISIATDGTRVGAVEVTRHVSGNREMVATAVPRVESSASSRSRAQVGGVAIVCIPRPHHALISAGS